VTINCCLKGAVKMAEDMTEKLTNQSQQTMIITDVNVKTTVL